MSKFIYVCQKNKVVNENFLIEKICSNIKPDNLISKNNHISSDEKGVTFGIFNSNESNLIKKNSVCLGYTDSDNWHEIGSSVPDGNFALIRSNSEYLEVISDILATRTIWYVHTDDYFVAATSQRMLISYLGSYMPNEEAVSWMLASGHLGYGNSWDKRIKCVPTDTKLTLNRKTWELSSVTNKIEFNPISASYSSHKKRLKNVIKKNVGDINLDLSKWVLPISGGYDSRGILLNLAKNENLKTITWGLKNSINELGTDAYVAKQLTDKMGYSHKYYHTDFSEESIKTIFERFFKIGEGRTDNIAGYLDGFKIWNDLYNEGYQGIIRGDEGFGWATVKTEKEARVKNGLSYLTDYDNLKPYLKDFPEIELSDDLLKKENESIETWRDRLWHQFSHPTKLAALNDLKLAHVEIINPLLFREIILTNRTIPDKLRTEKKLFKDIVDSSEVSIQHAKYGSNMEIKSIFKQQEVVNEIRKELQSSNILPKPLIDYIIKNMNIVDSTTKANNKREKIIRTVKATLPIFIKDMLKRNIPTNIDVNLLGFRAYLIVKMDKILKEDAKLMGNIELK